MIFFLVFIWDLFFQKKIGIIFLNVGFFGTNILLFYIICQHLSEISIFSMKINTIKSKRFVRKNPTFLKIIPIFWQIFQRLVIFSIHWNKISF